MSVFSPAFSNYFYMIPWGNGSGNPEAVQYYSGSFVPASQYNGDLIPQNWRLTEAPLPSTWSLLIAGFLGLGFFAYRGTKRNSAALAAA
jgi:hypothetical protein